MRRSKRPIDIFVLSFLTLSLVQCSTTLKSRSVATSKSEQFEKWTRLDYGWQRFSDNPSSPSLEDSQCIHPNMIRVDGMMLVGRLERLQDSTCENLINKKDPVGRCGKFNETQWKEVTKSLPRKQMGFCIDRFEYPNEAGKNPTVMMTYFDAEKACKSQGKRLCTDEEWTFACEGEAGTPYPYGYERSAKHCNQDQMWTEWNDSELHSPNIEKAATELERLWKGFPSGTQAKCKSSFGVQDMTGNVDEWTERKLASGKYRGAQKGGYWGPVRTRCRPTTTAHDENYSFYQSGTRCCSDK